MGGAHECWGTARFKLFKINWTSKISKMARQAVNLLPREVKVVFSGQEVRNLKLTHKGYPSLFIWTFRQNIPAVCRLGDSFFFKVVSCLSRLMQLGGGIASGASLSHCAGDENPCRQVKTLLLKHRFPFN